MSESDDEIYKKAYADEQERIRIEAIKAKAQEDAQLAALGLSPRQKKTRLGRWVQKQKLLMSGGQKEFQDLTRHDLKKSIREVAKKQLEARNQRIKRRFRDRREQERREKDGVSDRYRIHLHVDPNYIPKDEMEILVLTTKLNALKKELKLRERLNTY